MEKQRPSVAVAAVGGEHTARLRSRHVLAYVRTYENVRTYGRPLAEASQFTVFFMIHYESHNWVRACV